MTDLASLVVRMQADNSQYIKALDQAKSKLEKFSKDQESAFTQMGEQFSELGQRIAAGFALEKIIEFTASSIESAAALEKMSQSTGISTEGLSSLRLAAAASGMTLDDMSVTFKKLNVSISDAAGNSSSKAAVAFDILGISVKNANGSLKTADQILPELASKYANLADGPNKVAITTALMGKNAQGVIPILNQGADGLEQFAQQARDAGLVISGELAKSAEEFSQKINVMRASLVDGLSVRLATQLLPVLNELMGTFGKVGGAGAALDVIAQGMVYAIKAIADVAIETVLEFTNLGNSIGAVAAAAVAIASGNFKEAADIWHQSSLDNEKNTKDAQERIVAIYKAGGAEQVAAVKSTADEKAKADTPNLAAAEEARKALDKLEALRDQLKEQSQAYDLGGAAAVRFRLSVGALAKDLEAAGPKGKAAADAAIAYATALDFKKDTKTTDKLLEGVQKQIDLYEAGDLAAKRYELSTGDVGKTFERMGVAGDAAREKILALDAELIKRKDASAIQAINDQIDVMQGKLVGAAAAAFDLQHRALSLNLEATNDTAGQAALQNLKDKEIAMKAFEEEAAKANRVQLDLSSTETVIAAAQQTRQITSLQAQQQLEAARATALDQLNAIYTAEKKIADDSGLPKLIEETQAFKNSIVSLSATTNALEQQIRGNLENALVGPLTEAEMGTKSLKQAFSDMIKSIEKDLLTIANKNIAESLFGTGGAAGGAAGGLASLFGGGSGGGSGGGLALGLASLFGAGGGAGGATAALKSTGGSGESLLASFADAGLASGGTIPKGQMRLVGENGPEFAYSGAKDMQIVPQGQSGKAVQVTNHFTVQSDSGTISRQSQMQVAAAAARSLSMASRRNN